MCLPWSFMVMGLDGWRRARSVARVHSGAARGVSSGMLRPILSFRVPVRHSREGGNPLAFRSPGKWIPAFAGMTNLRASRGSLVFAVIVAVIPMHIA